VHDFDICKENSASQCQLPTVFVAEHVLKLEVSTVQPLIFFFASSKVMHPSRFDSPLRINIKNTYQIGMEK